MHAEVGQLRDKLRAAQRDVEGRMAVVDATAADRPSPPFASPARAAGMAAGETATRNEAAMLQFARLTGLQPDSLAAQMYLQDANFDVEVAVRSAVQGARGYSAVSCTGGFALWGRGHFATHSELRIALCTQGSVHTAPRSLLPAFCPLLTPPQTTSLSCTPCCQSGGNHRGGRGEGAGGDDGIGS